MFTNMFSKSFKSLFFLLLFVGFSSSFAQAQAPAFMGCQQMSNTLGTNHNVTWGSANPAQQAQWTQAGCNTRPQAGSPAWVAEAAAAAARAAANFGAAVPFMGCQQMSNTLGTNHGVTWGSANALQQQQWQANGCNTRPQAAAPVAAAPVAAAPVAAAPGAAPTLDCRSGEVLSAKGCVSLAAAQLSINAGNAAVCTKNQTAYLANEEIVAKNKGNEIQVKIKAVEDEKISKDNKTNIDYAPNPKFDRSANDYQKNQLRLVLANNQQGAQDKIRALTNEQVAWTAQHKAKVENWLKDSSSNKSICP